MKVGIVGTGKIACLAIEKIRKIENSEIAAVWCHTPENGRILSEKYDIPNIYSDIDEFLADTSYTVVYIALPNRVHYCYMKKCLENGKNVICEKPFTISSDQTKELIELARQKKLFLFDGTANRYYRNYSEIKNRISQIGKIKMVHINMSQYSRRYDAYLDGTVLSAFDPEEYGGALYDLNSINVLFVVGLFGKPVSCTYFSNKGFNGVDTSGILILDYEGFLADCIAAKDSNGPGYFIVQGEKGYISMMGNPGLVENINLTLNGQPPVCIDVENVPDQRVNLFRKIFEIIEKEDYSYCYEKLKDTEVMMEILEKARNGQTPFILRGRGVSENEDQ